MAAIIADNNNAPTNYYNGLETLPPYMNWSSKDRGAVFKNSAGCMVLQPVGYPPMVRNSVRLLDDESLTTWIKGGEGVRYAMMHSKTLRDIMALGACSWDQVLERDEAVGTLKNSIITTMKEWYGPSSGSFKSHARAGLLRILKDVIRDSGVPYDMARIKTFTDVRTFIESNAMQALFLNDSGGFWAITYQLIRSHGLARNQAQIEEIIYGFFRAQGVEHVVLASVEGSTNRTHDFVKLYRLHIIKPLEMLKASETKATGGWAFDTGVVTERKNLSMTHVYKIVTLPGDLTPRDRPCGNRFYVVKKQDPRDVDGHFDYFLRATASMANTLAISPSYAVDQFRLLLKGDDSTPAASAREVAEDMLVSHGTITVPRSAASDSLDDDAFSLATDGGSLANGGSRGQIDREDEADRLLRSLTGTGCPTSPMAAELLPGARDQVQRSD